MIKKITHDLIDADYHWRIQRDKKASKVSLSKEYSEYIANYILSGIEKEGMEPPERSPSPKELRLEHDLELYEECLHFNKYNSWEPENV